MTVRRRKPDFESLPATHDPVLESRETERRTRPPKTRPVATIAALVAVSLAALAILRIGHEEIPDHLVARFAEDFVYTYLTRPASTSPTALSTYLGFVPNLDGMDLGSMVPQRVSATSIDREADVWSIHVSVDLIEAGNAGPSTVHRRGFQVRVHAVPELRAMSLPSPVPLQTAPSDLPHRTDIAPEPGDATTAIENTLTWFLTSDSPAGSLVPAGGFVTVELRSLQLMGDYGLAGVVATTQGGSRLRLDVPILREDTEWWPRSFSRLSN